MTTTVDDRTHGRGPHDSASSIGKNMALTALAELIGTYLLVLVGTAVAVAAGLHKNTAGPAYDSLAIALSFGLILIPIVGALGQVSGAHVNPAVTIGPAAAGKFPWLYVPAYLIAQMMGAVAASYTLWAAFGGSAYGAHLGAPAPAHGATDLQCSLSKGSSRSCWSSRSWPWPPILVSRPVPRRLRLGLSLPPGCF